MDDEGSDRPTSGEDADTTDAEPPTDTPSEDADPEEPAAGTPDQGEHEAADTEAVSTGTDTDGSADDATPEDETEARGNDTAADEGPTTEAGGGEFDYSEDTLGRYDVSDADEAAAAGDAEAPAGNDPAATGPEDSTRVGAPGPDDPDFADVDPDEVDPFSDIDPEPPEFDPESVRDEDYEPDPHNPPEADAAAPGAEADGGYADPTSTTTVETGEEYHDGPASDEEMPLADHIEEMVKRVGVVLVVMSVVAAVTFPFAERLINFLWFSYLPGTISQCPANPDISQGGAACARVYKPLALIFARLKVATLVGLVVSLPVFVYETYLFMRPGLYPTERRYYLASVPTSLVLAAAGVAFAHFLVLPAIFTYFVYYSAEATVIAFGLTETFDLMVLMLGGFAIIFQIPLFISLALIMGIVTRDWMAAKRLYFWGAFAGLAFLFSPDPTGMAPIIVAATMIALFEGTLLLAKWTGR